MKCVTLSLLAGVVAGVLAGGMVEEIQRDFHMGLFRRQQQSLSDFQRFTGALGDKPADQIVENDGSDSDGHPFKIIGGRSDGQTFPDFQSAVNRICDDQKNDCADLSNSGGASFKVSDCDDQRSQCNDANQPTEQDDQFLYFCDD
ncbi:hypothetical protein F4677DRAFT_359504 [Hypoxylon crocopeplum]|nr:hypothetical protein F4677DRAFT_359504 [Hypoxylon crocopeplum]